MSQVEKKGYSPRLMVKCAQMYYEEDMNQGEISEKLQVSKSSISRILSQAKEDGIVKVLIVNPIQNEYIHLEAMLEEKFGLMEAIVIDSKSNDPNEIKKELGKSCAEYLQRIVKDGQIIGVTWGTTLKEIANYVDNDRRNKVTFLPLLGGIGESSVDIHPNQIALNLAEKFKGDYKLLYAPFIVDNYNTKEIFVKDKNIEAFFALFDNVDIGIMGIGNSLSDSSTLLESGYFTIDDMKELKKQGAIGDICSLFFDENGNGDRFECNKRIIGIDLEGIKKIPLNIAVAGHESKAKSIRAAIKGGYVKVLITDEKTAKALVKMS